MAPLGPEQERVVVMGGEVADKWRPLPRLTGALGNRSEIGAQSPAKCSISSPENDWKTQSQEGGASTEHAPYGPAYARWYLCV